MAILFSQEILKAVNDELKSAKDSVQIITAYCKKDVIKQLNECISPYISKKRIMLRFRLEDILKGSTDFSVVDYCRCHGWKVYVRFDLHAKTYIVDEKRGFIGSANATNSGMNLSLNSNMEMGTLINIDETDIEKIESLYNEAILVDEEIYSKFKLQYDSIKDNNREDKHDWNEEIKSLFNPKIATLFSYELPDKNEFKCGEYISFLEMNYSGDILALKEAFRWSNCYLWLLNTLKENDGTMFFGTITAKLHNVLISDPKPYRKDVKQLLANMLNLIQVLGMEEIIIDKPNFSQRVTLRDIK